MSRINLLPWREARRQELQTQFFSLVGIVAACAGLIWYAFHFYHQQLIEVENIRINYVKQQIALIDKKIEEIKEFEVKKEALLSRMRAIEQLQGNRPLIVRLFDELVNSLPKGVTVTSIKQKHDNVMIEGLAQSNAHISSFMRKLEASDWLTSPKLKIIKESNVDSQSINSFNLNFKQVIPSHEEKI